MKKASLDALMDWSCQTCQYDRTFVRLGQDLPYLVLANSSFFSLMQQPPFFSCKPYNSFLS